MSGGGECGEESRHGQGKIRIFLKGAGGEVQSAVTKCSAVRTRRRPKCGQDEGRGADKSQAAVRTGAESRGEDEEKIERISVPQVIAAGIRFQGVMYFCENISICDGQKSLCFLTYRRGHDMALRASCAR